MEKLLATFFKKYLQKTLKKLTTMNDQEYEELILVPDYKEEDD